MIILTNPTEYKQSSENRRQHRWRRFGRWKRRNQRIEDSVLLISLQLKAQTRSSNTLWFDLKQTNQIINDDLIPVT